MKRWYVIQVYAGYEEAIKADIERYIKEEGLQDHFGEVLIPSAQLKQYFEVEAIKDQQLFPGYMLVEMEMAPESFRLAIANPRVLRFLGGKTPEPLTQKEVDRIFSQMRGEIKIDIQKEEFSIGSEIDIQEGPFSGFIGIIDKVDKENEKLTVMVSIFGRMTPVELGFNQIKR